MQPMQLLYLLRNFDADQAQLDVMLALSVFGKSLRSEYETHGLQVPGWLSDVLNKLTRGIAALNRDELERQLAEVRARKTALMTRDEKRAEADAEEKRLEALLHPEKTQTV